MSGHERRSHHGRRVSCSCPEYLKVRGPFLDPGPGTTDPVLWVKSEESDDVFSCRCFLPVLSVSHCWISFKKQYFLKGNICFWSNCIDFGGTGILSQRCYACSMMYASFNIDLRKSSCWWGRTNRYPNEQKQLSYGLYCNLLGYLARQ